MRRIIYFFGAVVLLLIVYRLFTFSVDETQKAVVLQFGEIVRVVDKAGLHFKTPLLQNVVYLEDRLLSADIKPAPIITVDKQRLTVDSYTLWRIRDPRRFVETMRGLRSNAEQRLDDIVYSLLRDVLGQKSFEDILKREFLSEVQQRMQKQVEDFGMQIVDVRIKRADLPEANEQAVYQRMMSERKQIAQRYRAEGEQEAQRIRAEADREVQIILAQARKRSEELKGEGDARALEIYAKAYNQNPKFFRFWRTLESYKKSFNRGSGPAAIIVLSTASEYLSLFESMLKEAGKQKP